VTMDVGKSNLITDIRNHRSPSMSEPIMDRSSLLKRSSIG
jgi:hypothetical protein